MPIDMLVLMTWTTRDRAPVIDEAIGRELAALLPKLAAKKGATIIELAIVATHVHVVVSLNGAFDLPVLAQAMKGASGRLINLAYNDTHEVLRWAPGYDARSVGRRTLLKIREYFDRQGVHHDTKLLARWSRTMDIAA